MRLVRFTEAKFEAERARACAVLAWSDDPDYVGRFRIECEVSGLVIDRTTDGMAELMGIQPLCVELAGIAVIAGTWSQAALVWASEARLALARLEKVEVR